MLPSTGYFKGINCPFYDSGLCERPYCHFRHVKKENQNVIAESIESGGILQKLVSAAVQKVLQNKETSGTTSTPLAAAVINSQTKATYNPTPISELNKKHGVDEVSDDSYEQRKKHIPVPYTPRKPTSIPLKRPVDTNGSSQSFVYISPPVKYTPGTDAVQLDQYTPKGSSESSQKYLPGSETELQKYTPKETENSIKRNYVPSDKSSSKKNILEYKPKVTSKTKTSFVTYKPTPRSLVPCFSSDEDEPVPKNPKLISTDFNGLDDLGAEFDILDQILDEEKPVQKFDKIESENSIKKESKPAPSVNAVSANTKESKKYHVHGKKDHEHSKKDRLTNEKNETKNAHKNTESEKKKSSNSKEKEKSNKKSSKDNSKSHKSSSRDKERSDKEKRQKYSSSKSSDKSSSNKSEKHSTHSNSHRRKKEEKSKNDKEKSKIKTVVVISDNDLSDTDGNNATNVFDEKDEETYLSSECDEEAIALECKRIFEEYVPTKKTNSLKDVASINLDSGNRPTEYIPSKKRISRTTDKNIKVLAKPTIKPDHKASAAQVMATRLSKVKEYHSQKQSCSSEHETVTKPEPPKTIFNAPNISSGKIRIAHVPYASTMMSAKKTIAPAMTASKDEPSTSSTIVQTIKKGTQRTAHVPNEKFIDRPGVLEPLGSRIPANIRSTYLNMMIDECLKIYLSPVDAYARAQHEELNTTKKCSAVQIYKNSAVLAVSRLRKELQECNGVKKTGSDCTTLQKIPQTVSGKTANAGSWSIENKNKRIMNQSQEFSGLKFYNNIKKWLLTEQQLQENGFPRPHTNREKGRAMIYAQKKQKPPTGCFRTCTRCSKCYSVDKKGFPAVKEECIYHPNNKYRVRGEVKYQCCSQDGTSDGCCIAPYHIYEYVDYDNLRGFVKTLPPENISDDYDYGVFSLDCEMCYTTHGLDLTRITVINSACEVVYETLVKPLHPILDYNTRYSGITEEQMTGVKTSLLEVQAALLSMFSSKTILIGHSLESDFKALKLIHDTVIDTSVLYPHKMGPPYKRALRNLSSEYLKKIIQNSVDGHDSAEDATVCMELIIYKLREDLKTR